MTRSPHNIETFIQHAGTKSLVLRGFTAFSWIAGAVMIGVSPWLFVSLTDIDGNPEPLTARLFLAGLCLATGLLCTVGMWIYLRLYPTQIVRTRDTVIFEFQRLIGTHAIAVPLKQISGGQRYSGRSDRYHTRHHVDAPYLTLRIAGWWLPLIIDLKSEVLDEGALNRLIKDAEQARAATAQAT